jgi:uncharacterized membrane protein
MKIKKFLLAGIAGGVADYLLGWLLYGMLFKDYFAEGEPNLVFITLGCFSYGFLFSYIFVRWANLVTFASGLSAGAVLGFFYAIISGFFSFSMQKEANYDHFGVNIVIMIVMGAIIGGIVAAVNGASSKNTAP